MIESMTGFGAAVRRSAHYEVSVELRSLNSKFQEIILKLPRSYGKFEGPVRNLISSRLQRGKINVAVSVEILSAEKRPLHLNKALAAQYLTELRTLAAELNMKDDISLSFLLSLPEVIPTEQLEEDPEEWPLIEAALQDACNHMVENRRQEGAALDRDLESNVASISRCLTEIQGLAPARMATVRERIQASFEEFRHKLGDADKNRFEQELLYYIEKIDINEEIVRLTQHLTFFEEVRRAPVSNGKQLNFISQEMGREINTIGSKANDARIQRLVVQMKDELEKIKEQILNIV